MTKLSCLAGILVGLLAVIFGFQLYSGYSAQTALETKCKTWLNEAQQQTDPKLREEALDNLADALLQMRPGPLRQEIESLFDGQEKWRTIPIYIRSIVDADPMDGGREATNWMVGAGLFDAVPDNKRVVDFLLMVTEDDFVGKDSRNVEMARMTAVRLLKKVIESLNWDGARCHA